MSGYNQFPGSAGGAVKFTVNSNMAKGEKRQKNSRKNAQIFRRPDDRIKPYNRYQNNIKNYYLRRISYELSFSRTNA